MAINYNIIIGFVFVILAVRLIVLILAFFVFSILVLSAIENLAERNIVDFLRAVVVL